MGQIMEEGAESFKFFVELSSILNPMGSIPIFMNPTESRSLRAIRRIASGAALTVLLVLGSVLVTGEALLGFLRIAISSYRVGGGLLMLLRPIAMMHARIGPVRWTKEEVKDGADRDSGSMGPLGIPLEELT